MAVTERARALKISDPLYCHTASVKEEDFCGLWPKHAGYKRAVFLSLRMVRELEGFVKSLSAKEGVILR